MDEQQNSGYIFDFEKETYEPVSEITLDMINDGSMESQIAIRNYFMQEDMQEEIAAAAEDFNDSMAEVLEEKEREIEESGISDPYDLSHDEKYQEFLRRTMEDPEEESCINKPDSDIEEPGVLEDPSSSSDPENAYDAHTESNLQENTDDPAFFIGLESADEYDLGLKSEDDEIYTPEIEEEPEEDTSQYAPFKLDVETLPEKLKRRFSKEDYEIYKEPENKVPPFTVSVIREYYFNHEINIWYASVDTCMHLHRRTEWNFMNTPQLSKYLREKFSSKNSEKPMLPEIYSSGKTEVEKNIESFFSCMEEDQPEEENIPYEIEKMFSEYIPDIPDDDPMISVRLGLKEMEKDLVEYDCDYAKFMDFFRIHFTPNEGMFSYIMFGCRNRKLKWEEIEWHDTVTSNNAEEYSSAASIDYSMCEDPDEYPPFHKFMQADLPDLDNEESYEEIKPDFDMSGYEEAVKEAALMEARCDMPVNEPVLYDGKLQKESDSCWITTTDDGQDKKIDIEEALDGVDWSFMQDNQYEESKPAYQMERKTSEEWMEDSLNEWRFQLFAKRPKLYNYLYLNTSQINSQNEILNRMWQSAASDSEYFVTQNGFNNPKKRDSAHLFTLHNIVIDIDCHYLDPTTDEFHETIDMLVDRIYKKAVNSDFIMPNSIVYTGRGLQLWWALVPASSQLRFMYDLVRSKLIETLDKMTGRGQYSGFSVDKAASKNYAGFYRLPFSVNAKNNRMVDLEIYHQGRLDLKTEYEKIMGEKIASGEIISSIPKKDKKYIDEAKKNRKTKCTRKCRNRHNLLGTREKMLHRLAEMRGYNIIGSRDLMLLILHSAYLSIGRSEEEAWEAVLALNNAFTDPLEEYKIRGYLKTSLEKKYRFTNKRIIEVLNMTKEECDILNFHEHVSYAKKSAENRSKKCARNQIIFNMFCEGKTTKEIAESAGCSASTVDKIIDDIRAWGTKQKEKENIKKKSIHTMNDEDLEDSENSEDPEDLEDSKDLNDPDDEKDKDGFYLHTLNRQPDLNNAKETSVKSVKKNATIQDVFESIEKMDKEKQEQKDEKYNKILTLYRSGSTQKEIAAVLGCNQSTVSRIIKKIESSEKKNKENPIGKNKKYSRIAKMHHAGMTQKKIADVLGCNQSTVSRIINKIIPPYTPSCKNAASV